MPVIRINKDAYSLIMDKHKSTKVPVVHIVSDLVLKHLKATKKQADPRYKAIKDIFFEYYEKHNGFKYQDFGPADGAHVKQIIKKLDKLNESNNDIADIFRVIMEKLPNFYKSKNIKTINGNFSNIIADIKQGTNKGRNLQQNGGIYDHRS